MMLKSSLLFSSESDSSGNVCAFLVFPLHWSAVDVDLFESALPRCFSFPFLLTLAALSAILALFCSKSTSKDSCRALLWFFFLAHSLPDAALKQVENGMSPSHSCNALRIFASEPP